MICKDKYAITFIVCFVFVLNTIVMKIKVLLLFSLYSSLFFAKLLSSSLRFDQKSVLQHLVSEQRQFSVSIELLISQIYLEITRIKGIVLIHPYFWGLNPVGKEVLRSTELRRRIEKGWGFISGWKMGVDDAIVDPSRDIERLRSLKCERAMVVIAENDVYRERGRAYYESLKGSGWTGRVELFETEEEQHVFHLRQPDSKRALAMLKNVASFINRA